MSKSNKTSSLEKIGYIKSLPKDADLNDYEKITISYGNNQSMKMFRKKSEKSEEDINNFHRSWKIYNESID